MDALNMVANGANTVINDYLWSKWLKPVLNPGSQPAFETSVDPKSRPDLFPLDQNPKGSSRDFIGSIESRNDYNAYNKKGSGAFGRYQFMPDTWNDIVSRNPSAGLRPYQEGYLPSPQEQDKAYDLYRKDVEKQLNTAGVAPTEINMALGWRYGPQGAAALLKAYQQDPNTPVDAWASSVFGPRAKSVIEQNGLTGKTIGEVVGGMYNDYSKFSGTPTPMQTITGQPGGPLQSQDVGSVPSPQNVALAPELGGPVAKERAVPSTPMMDAMVDPAAGPQDDSSGFHLSIGGRDMGEGLLRLGAGLLAGPNWSQGLAKGLEGVADVAKESRIDDRYNRLYGQAKFTPRGNMMDNQTGEIIGGAVLNNKTGQIGRLDKYGRFQPMNMHRYVEVTDSSASPIRIGGDTANKIIDQINADERSLGQLKRLSDTAGGIDQGLGRVANDLSIRFKTLFDSGKLTPEELRQKIAAGELQGILGGIRLETLGGGVMTEPDATRLLLRLGANPGQGMDAFTNKEVMQQALKEVMQDKWAGYTQELEKYNTLSKRLDPAGGTYAPRKPIAGSWDEYSNNPVTIGGVQYGTKGALSAASQDTTEQPAKVTTQQEYDQLPSGALYVHPDGSVRRKK